MIERVSVAALAILGLLGLGVAPWAAVNRETGARSALLLLPDRIVDFTGRTEPLVVANLGLVLALSALLLLVILAGAFLRARPRAVLWLVGGLALIAVTAFGLERVADAADAVRIQAVVTAVEAALESPADDAQAQRLEAVVEASAVQSLSDTVAQARAAGVNIRRLPMEGAGMALGAFLNLVIGALAFLFSLKTLPSTGRAIGNALASVAVPLTSILLALLASAVVILLLQPTPIGRNVEIEGFVPYLAGRLDTLWFAYQTLFANSLGTLPGFMESLKFATPLILTGLAVAFGFQAGLFNIGAPGQMVFGGIAAMLVGLYVPGPSLVVMPLAVLAAALGGAFWGAIPGFLKARFGANEVINTILLNYIAASFLLFILSSNPTFAASAIRIGIAIGVFIAIIGVLLFVPVVRRALGRSPRLSFAVAGVLLLGIVVVAGLPRPGDTPVTVTMPFKQPGFEPKSYQIRPEARLPQVPGLLGIDLQASPGTNVVRVNYAWPLGLLAFFVALALAPRLLARARAPLVRLGISAAVGAAAWAVALLAGLGSVATAVPPTSLNVSFLIALGAAVLMYVLLWRTAWGYELRAVGVAPKAAEYGGANIPRNIVLAMAISGAFAGLTASHYVLGGALEDFSLRQSLPTSDGFDGIAVALLGGNTPVGVVLSAFLFGVLKNGGSILNITFSGLTRDVVNMILALVVLFIAAKGFLPERFTNPLRRRTYAELDPEATEPIDGTGRRTRAAKDVREDA